MKVNCRKNSYFLFVILFSWLAAFERLGMLPSANQPLLGFPIHMLPSGKHEAILRLRDPFYSVDSRDYQVIQLISTFDFRISSVLCMKRRPMLLSKER
jgi:hypothetical protein